MPELLELIAEARGAALEGHFRQAADGAQEILDSHPSCLAALRVLAWAQLRLDEDAALDSFQACATLDPEDALAEVGQAIWYERHELPERAAERFIRAWELEPHDQRIRREVVRLGGELPESPLAEGIGLMQLGRNDEATGPLRLAAASNPNDVVAPLALATVLWRLGGKQQAYNLATTILASRPQCVKAILHVLAQELASGRTLRTRELIARAEQVDPGLQLYEPVVRELGLKPVLDRQQPAARPAGAFGR